MKSLRSFFFYYQSGSQWICEYIWLDERKSTSVPTIDIGVWVQEFVNEYDWTVNKCETNTNTNLQYTIQHEQKKMRKHSTWDGTIQWRASIFRSFILASRYLSYSTVYSHRNTRSNNIQGHFLWVSTYQMNCARKRFSFYFNSQCEFFMIYAFCFVFFSCKYFIISMKLLFSLVDRTI